MADLLQFREKLPELKGMTDHQAVEYISAKTGVDAKDLASDFGVATPTFADEVGRGMGRAVDQIQGMGYAGLGMAADVVGLDKARDWSLNQFKRNITEAEANAAAVPSYENVHGIGDAALYGAGAVGEMIPQLIPGLGSAGIGAKLAATAAAKEIAAKQLKGEAAKKVMEAAVGRGVMQAGAGYGVGSETANIYGDIYEKTGEYVPGTALAHGIPAGLVEGLSERLLFKDVVKGRPKDMGRLKYAGQEAGKQFVTGGVGEELPQSYLEQAAVQSIDPTREIDTRDLIDSTLKGGIGSGAVGAGSGLITKSVNPDGSKRTWSDAVADVGDSRLAKTGLDLYNRLTEPSDDELAAQARTVFNKLPDFTANVPADADAVTQMQVIHDNAVEHAKKIISNPRDFTSDEFKAAQQLIVDAKTKGKGDVVKYTNDLKDASAQSKAEAFANGLLGKTKHSYMSSTLTDDFGEQEGRDPSEDQLVDDFGDTNSGGTVPYGKQLRADGTTHYNTPPAAAPVDLTGKVSAPNTNVSQTSEWRTPESEAQRLALEGKLPQGPNGMLARTDLADPLVPNPVATNRDAGWVHGAKLEQRNFPNYSGRMYDEAGRLRMTQKQQTTNILGEVLLNEGVDGKLIEAARTAKTKDAQLRTTTALMQWVSEGMDAHGKVLETMVGHLGEKASTLFTKAYDIARHEGLVADNKVTTEKALDIAHKLAAMHKENTALDETIRSSMSKVFIAQLNDIDEAVPHIAKLLRGFVKDGMTKKQEQAMLAVFGTVENLNRAMSKVPEPKGVSKATQSQDAGLRGSIEVNEEGELSYGKTVEDTNDGDTRDVDASEVKTETLGVGPKHAPRPYNLGFDTPDNPSVRKKLDELTQAHGAKQGTSATELGIWTMTKQDLAGDTAAIEDAGDEMIQQYATKLVHNGKYKSLVAEAAQGTKDIGDFTAKQKQRLLSLINAQFRYLKVDTVEAEKDPRHIDDVQKLKYKLKEGETYEQLTAARGFVFLEQKSGEQFPVYTKALLTDKNLTAYNAENPNSSAVGAAGALEKVLYNLSNILSSSERFTQRMGYRTADGTMHWLQDKDKASRQFKLTSVENNAVIADQLPPELMIGNASVGQARAQQIKELNEEKKDSDNEEYARDYSIPFAADFKATRAALTKLGVEIKNKVDAIAKEFKAAGWKKVKAETNRELRRVINKLGIGYIGEYGVIELDPRDVLRDALKKGAPATNKLYVQLRNHSDQRVDDMGGTAGGGGLHYNKGRQAYFDKRMNELTKDHSRVSQKYNKTPSAELAAKLTEIEQQIEELNNQRSSAYPESKVTDTDALIERRRRSQKNDESDAPTANSDEAVKDMLTADTPAQTEGVNRDDRGYALGLGTDAQFAAVGGKGGSTQKQETYSLADDIKHVKAENEQRLADGRPEITVQQFRARRAKANNTAYGESQISRVESDEKPLVVNATTGENRHLSGDRRPAAKGDPNAAKGIARTEPRGLKANEVEALSALESAQNWVAEQLNKGVPGMVSAIRTKMNRSQRDTAANALNQIAKLGAVPETLNKQLGTTFKTVAEAKEFLDKVANAQRILSSKEAENGNDARRSGQSAAVGRQEGESGNASTDPEGVRTVSESTQGTERPSDSAATGTTEEVKHSKQKTKRTSSTPEQQEAAKSVVEKLVGKDKENIIILAMKKMTGHGSWQDLSAKDALNIIRLAINGDMMGAAFHESFHELVSIMRKNGAGKTSDIIERVAMSPLMQKRLRLALEGHPEAIKQLSQPEEAAAFMFQMWNMNPEGFKIGPETRTTFEKIKDMLKTVAGFVSDTLRAENQKRIAENLDAITAENFMRQLSDGVLANKDTRAAVADAMNKDATAHENAVKNINSAYNHLVNTAGQFVMSSEAVMEATGNKHLAELVRMFHQKAGTAMRNGGTYSDGLRMQTNKWLNKVEDILLPYKDNKEELELARQHLSKGTDPDKIANPVVQEIVKAIRKFFDEDMQNLIKEKDIRRFDYDANHIRKGEWNPISFRKGYWSQVINTDYLSDNMDTFIAELQATHPEILKALAAQANLEAIRNAQRGYTPKGDENKASATVEGRTITEEDIAVAIATRLLNSQGQFQLDETESELGMTPMARAVNRRKLDWLDMNVFDKYMSKDLSNIMSTYTRSIVKRGEYQSRFGYDGNVIQTMHDKAVLHELGGDELVKAAEKALPAAVAQWEDEAQAAKDAGESFKVPEPTLRSVGQKINEKKVGTDAHRAALEAAVGKLELATKAVQALEGTLGNDITPTLRSMNSWLVTYQNFRTLSMMLFTSFQDVNGLLVNGGTLNDAWVAFTTGIKEIGNTWKNVKNDGEMMQRAEMWGAVDAGSFLDALGQAHASPFMTGKAKVLSDKFFKYTGAEGWNRGIRSVASSVAERIITEWKTEGFNYKDKAAVARLERLFGKGAKAEDIKLDAEGRLDINDAANQAAVTRWMLDAVPAPTAAHRPIWGSDPHFQMFMHLKNYTYTFHRVMLKGAVEQAKLGNYQPIAQLSLGYIPIAIAAGAIKEMLIPGDEPAWMKGGLGSYLEYGFARAGVLGVPQMYSANLFTPSKLLTAPSKTFDNFDPVALVGTTPGQLEDILVTPFFDSHTVIDEALGSLPGGNVLRRLARP